MRNFNKADVSVALLVSTYNSSDYLSLVMKSIFHQHRKPNEIIIAEDGCDPTTYALVNSFREKHDIPIIHVRQDDLGFRKSLILNKAVEKITADYIIEIDGDVILDQFFIADHLRFCHKGGFIQGGRVLMGTKKTSEILEDFHVRVNLLSRGIKNRINAFRLPLLAELYARISTSHSLKSRGCNLAYWKMDYVNINGYNNDFIGWGLEDTEFSLRMINSGVKKKTLKFAAVCYHLDHQFHSRSNFMKNTELFHNTLTTKTSYSVNGYREAPYIR